MSRLKLFLVVLILCSSFMTMRAQEDPSALVKQGAALYDQGKYEESLTILERARSIWPTSTTILYEIALTRFQLNDWDGVIRLADSIIARQDINNADAFGVKAAALLKQGKVDESTNTLIDGISITGGDYKLFFNLGVNFMNQKKANDAEICFLNAIQIKPTHANSYLLLAKLNQRINPVKSLLAACQFLLLEPKSEQSKPAFHIIDQILTTAPIPYQPIGDGSTVVFDSNYVAVNHVLDSLIQINVHGGNALNIGLFENQLKEIVQSSAESMIYDEDDVWRGYLIPFYTDIFKDVYGEVFCNYIAQSQWKESVYWLEMHREELTKFGQFLKGEEDKK